MARTSDEEPVLPVRFVPFRVSELGRKVLETQRAYAEANYLSVCLENTPEPDAEHSAWVTEHFDRAFQARWKAVNAIMEAPVEKHLGDLVVALRCLADERGHQPDPEEDAIADTIMRHLLKAMGVTEEECWTQTQYDAAERRIGPLTFPDGGKLVS